MPSYKKPGYDNEHARFATKGKCQIWLYSEENQKKYVKALGNELAGECVFSEINC